MNDKNLAIRCAIERVVLYIKEAKINKGVLTDQATDGFNLACDFLSHQLFEMTQYDTFKTTAFYEPETEVTHE